MPTAPASAFSVGSFDLTFDHTFRGVNLTATVSVDACRKPGAYLNWLSPTGWAYWLFEGPMYTRKIVSSRGSRQQAGVLKHNQKESFLQLTAYTSGLTTARAEEIATVYESSAVFLIVPDAAGIFQHVEVSVDPGSFDVHNTQTYTHTLGISFALPARRSARS